MKKIVLVALAVIGFTSATMAQQAVIPAQVPKVAMSGDFNNGTGDTSYHTSVTTGPVFYTRLDTATHTGAVNDSVRLRLVGEYNSVGFEIHAIRTGGKSDSCTIQLRATKKAGNGDTYALLQTWTMADVSTEQIFTYDPNAGLGNAWTNYRIVVTEKNLATSSAVQWQAWALVR